jgi:hypothetical protein
VNKRHNEIRDELGDIAAKAFIPSAIRNEPLIHSSCPAVKMPVLVPTHPSVTLNLRKNRNADRGDLSIRGLWQRQTDCIIGVRVTDTDAKSNLSKDSAKVLQAHEKEKKRKYLAPCIDNADGHSVKGTLTTVHWTPEEDAKLNIVKQCQ